MISRTWSRMPIALGLAVAVLSMYSMVVLAAPGQGQTKMSGVLTVSGDVTVDGAKAVSGATVFPDSIIATAQNSSASVSLGKLGRVELMSNSSVKLGFTEAAMNASLDAGKARVATSQGTAASVMTKDGSAVADSNQASIFTVDVECGNTFVATQAGRVELRAGSDTKQIAAGQDATAGQATAGQATTGQAAAAGQAPGTRCTRLRTEGMQGIGGGALAALLLAAGGAIAAVVFATTSDNNDLQFGGNTTVISPTR